MTSPHAPVRAFTLIELLVVIAIVAILAGILLPALSSVKEAAKTMRCMSSLRQLGMVVEAYTQDSDSFLPYQELSIPHYEIWLALIYPYLDLGPEDPAGWNSSKALAIGNGRTIARGCPEWKGTSAYAPGYGFPWFPGFPAIVRRPDPVAGAFAGEVSKPACSNQSRRILLGETQASYLSIDVGSGWFTNPAALQFTIGAGDAARHTRTKSNYCFFDLHAQTILASKNPWVGLQNPAASTWNP